MQVTMSKGLTEDAVKRLMQLRIQVDKRFTTIEQQLDEVKQTIGDHTIRLERMKQCSFKFLRACQKNPELPQQYTFTRVARSPARVFFS